MASPFTGVVGLATQSLRRSWTRTVATTGTILLAVTSFVVLTASAQTSTLVTTGTVDSNFRASYDILVRPTGSQTPEEQASGRVRPNYLSGLFGGISLDQVAKVRAVPGVEVAAPVAMIGEVLQRVDLPVEVTTALNETGPTLLRFSSEVATTHGATRTSGWAGYVYVADRVSLNLGAGPGSGTVQQTLVSGKTVNVCPVPKQPPDSPLARDALYSPQCWDRVSGQYGQDWPDGQGRVFVQVPVTVPVMLAAVDPVAEDQLTGLASAVTRGRMLSAADDAKPAEGTDRINVPVLTTPKSFLDEDVRVRVEKLPARAAASIAEGRSFDQTRATVQAATGTPVGTDEIFTAQQAHDLWFNGSGGAQAGVIYPRMMFQPSSVTYTGSATTGLTPTSEQFDPDVWRNYAVGNEPFAFVPVTAARGGYRTVTAIPAQPGLRVALSAVGAFDPTRLTRQSALSKVPLETYEPPVATAADASTAKLLQGKTLQPDSNPAGYLQAPPLLLTSLANLPSFADPTNFSLPTDSKLGTAPVSAVRVRVAGVTGADPVSRERIRLAAEQIQQATGLAVDVTAGSSPAATRISLPAAQSANDAATDDLTDGAVTNGTPALVVTEQWTQKGVAAAIITAIDKKSLTLFILILASAALAIAISANAAVRARRTQLGVLACVGWRPSTLLREVLAELVLIGLAGGIGGAILSWPVAAAMGIEIPAWRALLAIPAALVLALAAGILPALTASRAAPIEAVRPAVSTRTRWQIRLRGPASLALGSLSRTPGRVVAGAASLALGVTALGTLLGIVTAFNGAIVGTLLGDAVSVQVRGPDVVAAVLLTVIGLTSLADILFLDIKEQAPGYASLRAFGWRDRTLSALIAWQALIIAAVGALVGVAGALLLLSTLTEVTAPLVVVTAAVGVGAVLAALLVSIGPALSLRRIRTARLLTAE